MAQAKPTAVARATNGPPFWKTIRNTAPSESRARPGHWPQANADSGDLRNAIQRGPTSSAILLTLVNGICCTPVPTILRVPVCPANENRP